MRVFDGHNDAITRDDRDGLVSGRPAGDLDLPRCAEGGLGGGVFAIFTPSGADDATPSFEVASAYATDAADRLLAFEATGALRVARSASDLDADDGPLVAVMGLEGAEAIDPGLSSLEEWYARGLRVLGPVWSRSNAFGHGVPFDFPSSPDTGPGLTRAGTALVARCHALGIAVDLSHLNEAGFWDVARLDEAPLVASHSACHALSPSARNLTDAQLRAVAASDGVVGVVFAVRFLREDGLGDPSMPLSTLVAHVRHAVEVAGIDHVGFGSDFDGAEMPSALSDVSRLPALVDALRADGFTEDELERLCWSNWRRVLGACW